MTIEARHRAVGASSALFSALLVVGCSPPDPDAVATLGDTAEDIGGYLNVATAAYADCLEQQDLPVAPLVESDDPEDFVPPAFVGYAEIAEAIFTSGGPDGPSKDFDYTIDVDGVDRTGAIRECYESNPGAKDAMLDMNDDPGIMEEWTPPEEEVDATLRWAECARDAGVSMIEDPGPDGYLIIPEGLELSEAKMLGQECSAPMAQEGDFPLFQYDAAVEDPDTGVMDITAYSVAIGGPFLEVMSENNPDECSDSE